MPDENLIPSRLKEMPGSEWLGYAQPEVKAPRGDKPEEGPLEMPEIPKLNLAAFLDANPLENLNQSGWYREGARTTGKPQTIEEQQFVLDYLATRGMLPTAQETANWKLEQDEKGFTYAQDSTMGRLGFLNYEDVDRAFRYGENYGPYRGDLVPEGTAVITDEQGRNLLRFTDPSRVPQGYRDNILPQGAGVYPSYDRSPFERPTMEDALGRYAPVQVYAARLNDYLTAQMQQDAPEIQRYQDYYNNEIKGFKDRLAQGKIDQDTFNEGTIALQKYIEDKLSGLMTEDRASEMEQEAVDLINKGYAAEELPMYADVSGATGASVQDLYNQSLTEAQQQYDQRITNIPENRGFIDRSEAPQNDNAQAQYLTYVDQLQVAPEYMEWLKGNYYDIYELWKQAKADYPRFIDFVQDYLARGGM